MLSAQRLLLYMQNSKRSTLEHMRCVADWRRKARSALFAVFLLSAAAKVCPPRKATQGTDGAALDWFPFRNSGGRGIGENQLVAEIDEKGPVVNGLKEQDSFSTNAGTGEGDGRRGERRGG